MAAVARYAAWQMRLRVQREASYGWIDGAQLLVRSRGGRATGNVYCGLQEFADMAFVLHLLRPNDLYVEVGAADGAYAVLAGRCCGAPVVCLEADAGRAAQLRRHVTINEIWKRSSIHEVAAGNEVRMVARERRYDPGEVGWGLDAVERFSMVTVDALLAGRQPALLRVGVRRTGAAVLEGATRTLRSETLGGTSETARAGVGGGVAGAGVHAAVLRPTGAAVGTVGIRLRREPRAVCTAYRRGETAGAGGGEAGYFGRFCLKV